MKYNGTITYILPIAEPCENLDCKDTSDTCSKGNCNCGSTSIRVCDSTSEFPLCSEGLCLCSKTRGEFVKGDGTTQGSCNSNLHKCQADGQCVECIDDSQCTVVANKCAANICSCGDTGPCNATRSNLCTNGVCMCGSNPQCSDELKVETESDCSDTKCSYQTLDKTCLIQRSPQEVCEEVSSLYNPLYKVGGISGAPENCDDGIGKFPGEYHCLGKAFLNIFKFVLLMLNLK